MLLLWNKIRKIYSPCSVSVVHLAYFVVLGDFEVFVAAFYRQSWTELFEGLNHEAMGGGGGERVMQLSGKSQLSCWSGR